MAYVWVAIVRKKGVADVTKRGVADVTKKGVANVRMGYVLTPICYILKMTVRGTMVRSEVCNSWCFCLES